MSAGELKFQVMTCIDSRIHVLFLLIAKSAFFFWCAGGAFYKYCFKTKILRVVDASDSDLILNQPAKPA
jgi:hypothetical protein